MLGAREATRWPDVTAEIAHSESHGQQPGFGDERIDVKSNDVGVASLWELDLFGRVRRGVEAAGADAGAADARLRDAQVLVAAEVARNYLELRGAQKRLAVARTNLEYQRETFEPHEGAATGSGRGTQLDVSSAARAVLRDRGGDSGVRCGRGVRGESPRGSARLSDRARSTDELAPREIAPHLTTLAVGAPEDLLNRRPDIRAAERDLAAATARIGAREGGSVPAPHADRLHRLHRR